MKFLLFGRPYNLGMGWQHRRTVEASSHLEALETTEHKEEKFHLHLCETRCGILGGVSEWLALTEAEFEEHNKEFGLRYPASVG
jgi:hypothetical protein